MRCCVLEILKLKPLCLATQRAGLKDNLAALKSGKDIIGGQQMNGRLEC